MKSRISFVKYLFLILLLFLAFRMFSIQAVMGDEYSEAAAVQRWRYTRIHTERGHFWTGRIKLTNRHKQSLALIQPADLRRCIGAEPASDLLGKPMDELEGVAARNYRPMPSRYRMNRRTLL